MNPKKYPKTMGAVIIFIIALAYSYSWTYTPYGRLDYPAAVSLHLLTFPYTYKPDPTSDFEVKIPVNLAFSLDKLLPTEKVGKVQDIQIPGQGVDVPVRIYWPRNYEPTQLLPVVVYFHGGGFMLGSVDTFDPVARSLANAADAIVLSVDYRLAPAHPYPAGLNDCYAAVKWTARHIRSLGGNPRQLVVAGDSAGGNLATVVALKAHKEHGPVIAAQILYYPVVDLSGVHYPSFDKFIEGYGSSREMDDAFHRAYISPGTDKTEPYVSPLYADSLAGLPPALIFTAGFDRLTDATNLYIKKLKKDGVAVTAHNFPGIIHGFMSVPIFQERRTSLNETHRFLAQALRQPSH